MIKEVSSVIHKTSTAAAAVAAVLSPIPLADELILFPMYTWLSRRIARAHNLDMRIVPWKPISFTAINGLVARAGLNLAVSFVPGVAAVANAASAVMLTEFFGRYVNGVCESPGTAKTMVVKEIIDLLRRSKQSTGDQATAAAAAA